MSNIRKHHGLSGDLEIPFALPTDDPTKWRMRDGKVSFCNGAVAGLDVKGGYMPHSKGSEGLTVTYYIFNHIKQDKGRMTGDVTMTTCVNGRVMDVNDIAFGIEVIPVSDMAAALASVSQTPSELVPSHS